MLAKDYMKDGRIPVVFALLMDDDYDSKGFSLNDSRYTDFLYEREVILPEGFDIYSLGVFKTDHNISRIIKNKNI